MITFLVEGDGDKLAVPILLQKTIGRQLDIRCIDMGGKSNIVREKNGFDQTIIRQIELGFKRFRVLMDADVFFFPYKNVVEEKRGMQKRAEEVEKRYGVEIRVFWAIKSYESWLIGGLRKGDVYCGLSKISKIVPGDTQSKPPAPKEWLREHLEEERYTPYVQACLSNNVHWTLARRKNHSLRLFLKSF